MTLEVCQFFCDFGNEIHIFHFMTICEISVKNLVDLIVDYVGCISFLCIFTCCALFFVTLLLALEILLILMCTLYRLAASILSK